MLREKSRPLFWKGDGVFLFKCLEGFRDRRGRQERLREGCGNRPIGFTLNKKRIENKKESWRK
jgi:hypothetical protein